MWQRLTALERLVERLLARVAALEQRIAALEQSLAQRWGSQ
jgi:uncharacterized protein YceH (UPF0502 family)